MTATTALASAGFSQPPRFVRLGGLFQRASIIAGFAWLTALSARALRQVPATPGTVARPDWGEMLLFWMDRADSLSGVARHLERRVADYIRTNIYVTSSGMLQERLLRHTLDFTSAERVLFSTDYPFHRPDATATGQFFDAIADPAERAQIASGNAETLFRLA